MEMKDPRTTAQPQPPSGGGTAEGPVVGGGIVNLLSLHSDLSEMEACVRFPQPGRRGDLGGVGQRDACVREWLRGCVLFKFPQFDVEPLRAKNAKRAALYAASASDEYGLFLTHEAHRIELATSTVCP